MSIPWQPLGDQVIVLKTEGEEELTQSRGGIIIADTAKKDPPNVGEVVAVGPGRRMDDGSLQEMELQCGDVVIYSKYAGTELFVSGEEYKIISEGDVKARRTKE